MQVLGEEVHLLFVMLRVCSVPKDMRQLRGEERSLKETLELVFEADASVLRGELARTGQGRAPYKPGKPAKRCTVTIGSIGQVTGEEFVGTFSAQRHGCRLARHL